MRSNIATTQPSGRTFIEAARRSQIIQAAIDTVGELGYARASLAEIARRAGISKGVISYHFAGKDDLTEQIVLELYTRAGASIGERVDVAGSAVVALCGYVEANLAFVAQNPQQVRVLVDIFMNFRRPDGSPHIDSDGQDGLLEHLGSLLRQGQESGEFRPFAIRPMAIIIRSAIDAASGQLVLDPKFDVKTYAAELTATLELATRRDTP